MTALCFSGSACYTVCLCLHFPLCCVCVCVDRQGVGNRFERALSISSVVSWSSAAGCGLYRMATYSTESGTEIILIKKIIGCLNLIRL